MKKVLSILCSILFLASIPPPGSAAAAANDVWPQVSFVLPASLITIEEEAFLGISAENVVFQDGLRHIREKAFTQVESLRNVFIPATVQLIADSAFQPNSRVIIHGEVHSAAWDWAIENNVHFTTDYWYVLSESEQQIISENKSAAAFTGSTEKPEAAAKPFNGTGDLYRSMRPQDRPELYPIDYRFP